MCQHALLKSPQSLFHSFTRDVCTLSTPLTSHLRIHFAWMNRFDWFDTQNPSAAVTQSISLFLFLTLSLSLILSFTLFFARRWHSNSIHTSQTVFAPSPSWEVRLIHDECHSLWCMDWSICQSLKVSVVTTGCHEGKGNTPSFLSEYNHYCDPEAGEFSLSLPSSFSLPSLSN